MPQKVVFIIAALSIALILLDQLALWMQRRRWIRWRTPSPRPAGGGGMAGLLTEFQQLVEPDVRHVIEVKEERRLERLNLSAKDPRGKGDGKGDPGASH